MRIVQVEDLRLLVEPQAPLAPGDTYVASRNHAPQLLTVNRVVSQMPGGYKGFVIPRKLAYSFDLDECAKVIAILD